MSTMPEVLDNLSAPPKRFIVGGITAAALAATAAWVAYRANRAERNDPQSGTFMDVDGTRLHYVDRGSGPVIVLLHGNALRLEDFVAAGMIDRLAKHHRVIAFDRPGFGHSDRPRMQLWTPDAQAELLQKALKRLGVSNAVIVGHSLGDPRCNCAHPARADGSSPVGADIRLLLSGRAARCPVGGPGCNPWHWRSTALYRIRNFCPSDIRTGY